MKKVLLILLLCSFLFITSCDKDKKKEKVKEDDTSLEKGSIVVVCKSDNLGDDVIQMKSTVTTNFDKNQTIMNYKVETIEEFSDKDSFTSRKKMYEDSYEQLKNTKDTIYQIKVDEKKMKITLITILKKIDISTYEEEAKKTYELNNYIKNYEEGAYICTIEGISREEIGLTSS